MRKGMKWTALLLALMMLAGCAQNGKDEALQLLEPVGVQSDMAAAYVGEIYKTSYYSASVKPYVESLSFKVSGKVMSANGYPGMMVEEGDILVELDQESLQKRAEQLQEELSYMQQDNAFSDAIAELDIKILQTELRQMKDAEAALKENETALQELLTALKEGTPTPAPTPEVSEPTPTPAPTPEVSEPTPTPEAGEPTPTPAPEESEPTPTPTPDQVPAAVDNEPEQPPFTEADIALLEQELVTVQEEIALLAHDIALKENEIDQKQAQLRQAKNLRGPDLQSKRKELEEISVSLDKNVMRAPFSGRIVYGDQLMQGSWVNADDPVVFLADDSRLKIVCEHISEGKIQLADRMFALIGDKEYEVKYLPYDREEYIALALSGVTLTSEFEIIASEEELARIEAGQYAAICLWSDYVPDALLVPSGAVLKKADGKYVYVDQNGSRVERMVKTGKSTDGLVQILEGLEEGEVVYVKD